MNPSKLCIAAIAALAACASAPPPAPVPDESTRRQVNAGLGIELQNCEANLFNTHLMLEQTAGAEERGDRLPTPSAVPGALAAGREGERGEAAPAWPRPNTVYVVLFRHGEHEIRLSDGDLARLIADAKHAAGVQVRGRTDATQDNALDRELAARRANAVLDLLVHEGVDPAKIRLSYQGQGDPISSNRDEKARALNRRAEIEIYRVPAQTVIFASRSDK
jgi:hypothetical protein